uniref:Uncharacterized protein n=1 Tax=Trichuris muris TaxID=70415 RepID=A0A5S6Q6Y7_TRIMR
MIYRQRSIESGTVDTLSVNNRFSLFSRPLLPSVTTKLSLSDQLKSHDMRIQEIEMSLANLRQNPPCRSCKSCQLVKFAEKEVYLLYELRRYKAYVELLHGYVYPAWKRWRVLQITIA